MSSKRSEKRLQQSQDFRENNNRLPNNSETPKASEREPKKLSRSPKAITSEELREYMRSEDHRILGPGGLRNILKLDANLDPVAIASIAANMITSEYSMLEDRRAIVRAAMLLGETQNILKEGPTIFDVPEGALVPLVFGNHPANQDHPDKRELDKINCDADPKKRFIARAKYITQQDRPARAETDLFEMLGEWAKEQGKSDIAAYKENYKKLLSSSGIGFPHLVWLRDAFAEWKAQSRSAKAAAAGKKSREKASLERS
jgi:hypothetical protein